MSSTYYTSTGSQVDVAEKLGEGGEGKIYAISRDPLVVAKIYIKSLSQEYQRKIELMVQAPPEDRSYIEQKHHSIAWPTALLYSDSRRTSCIGFLMPRIDLANFSKAVKYIQPEDRTTAFGGAFTWEHLFTTAYNMTSAVAAIHQGGYCIGDLNESNVLIARSALITLIDCDSFQVKESATGKVYRCPVGKPEYCAPELIGKIGGIDLTQASDCFALGVILFQLLMEGTHPFQAKGRLVHSASSTVEKIQRGYFPYFPKSSEIAPPDHAPPYGILHPDIRKLFERCFVVGHRNPQARPLAHEWFIVLEILRTKFQKCPNNENHRYLDHLAKCPWCQLTEERGIDPFPRLLFPALPFPSPVGTQVPLDDPSVTLNSLKNRQDHLRLFIGMALVDGPITSEEESRIAEIGNKLQLSQKEIRNLIEDIGKRAKSGPNPAVPPQLEISRTQFKFSNLRVGTNAMGSFIISNTGGGILRGPIRSQNSWLRLQQSSIDTGKHRQEITFTVQTAELPLGLKEQGTIKIQSNAGTHLVHVDLSTELPVIAISRWTKQLYWTGLMLGGVLGYGMHVLIPKSELTGAIVLAIELGALLAMLCKFFIGGKFSLVILTLVGFAALHRFIPAVIAPVAGALLGASLLQLTARKLFLRKQVKGLGDVAGISVIGAAVTVTGVLLAAGFLVPELKHFGVGNMLLNNVTERSSLTLDKSINFGGTEEGNGRPCKVWKPDIQPNESVRWTGDCANGYASGYGTAIWLRGGHEFLRYQGTFRSGLLQGRGVMIATGGDRYEGDYKNGERDGRGNYTTASGQRYEGQYLNNKKHGIGVVTEADGTRRTVRFVNGKQVE